MHCRIEATLTGNPDGTWGISGIVVSHKDGEVRESTLGHHVFKSESAGQDWLQLLAKAVGARDVSIVVHRPQRRPTLARTSAATAGEPSRREA